VTIPTDRLREIANPVYVPCVGQDEAIAIATELLACREELAAERERFNLLSQRCDAAERERDAYRKAKQENDERFMLERDAARAELATVKRQRDELVKACSAKDDLLACYRLGKRPSEALFKRLDKAKQVLEALAAEQPKPADITLPAYGIDHTGKVVKLVAAEQQKSQPVSRNQMLLDFAQDWTLDGDLLRCRECKRACIASREDEEFVHRSDCKKRRTGAMPWKALVAILMQQPTPQGGA